MNTNTKTESKSKIEELLSNPWILILWNDDINTFDWVIECLIKVCKHDPEQANQCAYIVHFSGKCDVKRGDRQTIEIMYDKLKSNGLSVTMELS